MNTLQTIREKVIEAVPEIADRDKPGCVLKNCWIDQHRPITLADVLRAIESTKPTNEGTGTGIRSNGQFVHFEYRYEYMERGYPTWNFSLNLDENIHENPELGEFLLKILV